MAAICSSSSFEVKITFIHPSIHPTIHLWALSHTYNIITSTKNTWQQQFCQKLFIHSLVHSFIHSCIYSFNLLLLLSCVYIYFFVLFFGNMQQLFVKIGKKNSLFCCHICGSSFIRFIYVLQTFIIGFCSRTKTQTKIILENKHY